MLLTGRTAGSAGYDFDQYDQAVVSLIGQHRATFDQTIRAGDRELGRSVLGNWAACCRSRPSASPSSSLPASGRGWRSTGETGRARAGGWVGAVAALALGLSLAACSATGPASIVGQQTLRIGVKADQPGLGLRLPDGRFAGFDVDVARYVAAKLGVRPDHITFVPVTSATREAALENGSVDMVIRDLFDHPGARDEGRLRRAVLRGPPGHHGPRRRHRDP